MTGGGGSFFYHILEEIVVFMGLEFIAIVMKTIFIGYFLYFLSYITKRLDTDEDEVNKLKERFAKMNLSEEERILFFPL